MATEADAREFTLNYDGGSLTMTLGSLKALLGPDFEGLTPSGEEVSVTVKTHTRTRVIGGPATNVPGFTYTYKQWPTSQANNAAAGGVVLLSWDGSDGQWTGRVTGSLSDLGVFLAGNAAEPAVFRSERGTKYGPFSKSV